MDFDRKGPCALKPKEKRFITLIAILVALVLLAVVAGVTVYNYRGAADEGRSFQTEQSMGKIQEVLRFELAKNPSQRLEYEWKEVLKHSPLVKKKTDGELSDEWIKDGWGMPFTVTVQNGTVEVYSQAYQDFQDRRLGKKVGPRRLPAP